MVRSCSTLCYNLYNTSNQSTLADSLDGDVILQTIRLASHNDLYASDIFCGQSGIRGVKTSEESSQGTLVSVW